MSETTETLVWGEIDGQEITFPMEVTDFDAATLIFSVPADAAQRLLPGADFSVIEVVDGIAQFVVALCDYHENPWGDYLELNLGFLARPVGAAPEVNGSFVYRMPVDQAFTCKAGNDVMGFPKTVEDLSVTRADGRVTFAWHRDGALVLSLDFPDAPAAGDPVRVETDSYSYLDGKPYATSLGMDLGTGAIDPADVVLELGDDVVADELRALGLPKTPDFGAWGTDLTASFQLGRPV
jgi:hypothetical protein